jgi:hypothetical protein
MQVQFAERFGWTLEYIDNLSVAQRNKILLVLDGRKRAMAKGRTK